MSRVARRKRVAAAYSFMDELLASPTEPMPEAMRTYHLTRIYQGISSLEKAPVPTLQDWQAVSDGVNMVETLIVEMKLVEDASGLLQDAVTALALAGKRYLAGGNLRLDASGIQAVRAIIEDYSSMLDVVPHRTMVRCHRLTEMRVMGVRAGTRKANAEAVVKL